MSKRQWYRIRAQADEAVADIYIYDYIGTSWWEDSVSAKQFLEELRALPGAITTLRIHVNSPGGDPFDATAIHNLLRAQAQNGRTIEVLIEGLAASAATIVTSAGDKVKIAQNALLMVHNPSGLTIGDEEDHRKMVDALAAIKGSIIASYRRLSSLSDDEITALMDAETWMDAEDALANGFCTEVMEPMAVAAHFDPRALKALGKVPTAYRKRVAAMTDQERVKAMRKRVRNQEGDAEWTVGGTRELPLSEDESWDADAAKDSLGDDRALWKKAHIVYNAAGADEDGDGLPDAQADYKLPFARKEDDGELRANKAGLEAARQQLDAADLPDDVKEDVRAFIDSYLGPEEEPEEPEEPQDVLRACRTAGCLDLAEGLIRARATVTQTKAAIDRAKEIRALCKTTNCPELADGYIRGGMPVAEIKQQLTMITAKLDKVEIDASLSPDARSRGGQRRLDPKAIYAGRNRLGVKKEG